MATLEARAWSSLVVLAVVMGLLLFGPAGTIHYGLAWVYLVLFLGLSGLMTLDLLHRDPALLERRMKGGPLAVRRPSQRLIMLGVSVGFIGLHVLPGLDFRFKWSEVPPAVVLLGDVLLVLGFGVIGRVYQENTFTAATIHVAPGQRVISTGPYAVVRHPMYAGALSHLGGTPLALGSYVGLLAFASILPFLVWRALDEERLLARELPGYTEYQARLRYRLVPLLW
jgi:protein-S-isoprenylcysteine O-methyltransferase Ste14